MVWLELHGMACLPEGAAWGGVEGHLWGGRQLAGSWR